MRWQGKDQDRLSVEDAKALFAQVKRSFPGRDGAVGGVR